MNNFRRFDLNLFVMLDVLFVEYNVMCVVEKLNMLQLFVSVQLQKLCDVFGDLLLLFGLCGMWLIVCVEVLCELLCDVFEVVECVVILVMLFDFVIVMNMWCVVVIDYGELMIVLFVLYMLCLVVFGMWLVVVELVLLCIEQDVE